MLSRLIRGRVASTLAVTVQATRGYASLFVRSPMQQAVPLEASVANMVTRSAAQGAMARPLVQSPVQKRIPSLNELLRGDISGKIEPVVEATETLQMDSVKRKRKKMMKKHKLRKRRKAQRALKIRLKR